MPFLNFYRGLTKAGLASPRGVILPRLSETESVSEGPPFVPIMFCIRRCIGVSSPSRWVGVELADFKPGRNNHFLGRQEPPANDDFFMFKMGGEESPLASLVYVKSASLLIYSAGSSKARRGDADSEPSVPIEPELDSSDKRAAPNPKSSFGATRGG